MKISVKTQYKSLPNGLEIDGLPDFSIITGENGSGKTHLLEYIKQHGVDGISTNMIGFIPSDW
jgi:recombinational DNA repair ATPase RecF